MICLGRVIFNGILSSITHFDSSFQGVQHGFNIVKIWCLEVSLNSKKCLPSSQRNIFFGDGLGPTGLQTMFSNTMSWSLLPIYGIGLHLCLKEGWAVNGCCMRYIFGNELQFL